ncbi:MAG: hypothetical protein H6718_01830 [Polyangiaceae bacterium]|nr:hypothetical protein [Polyangiaceae bacterium]
MRKQIPAAAWLMSLVLGACSGGEATPGASGTGGSAGFGGSLVGGAGAMAGAAGAGAGGAEVGGSAGTTPTGGTGGDYQGPQLLSETGLYRDIGTRELAEGVVTYGVQYPLWSDGSVKTRYFMLPPGTTIDVSDPDHWVFPVGATAWKQFERDGKLIETRIVKKTVAGFDTVAYIWRPDGSDADVAPQGLENASGTAHDVPSESQCLECHTNSHDYFLGLSLVQLSTAGSQSELQRFAATGAFNAAPPAEYHAPGTSEQASGLGYLHGNCGHCHRAEHPLGQKLGLHLGLRSSDTSFAQTDFAASAPGVPAKHTIGGTTIIVVPGQPAQSQLWVRSGLRDLEAMPPLGTELVNQPGQDAIAQLILSLPSQ